MSFCVSFTLFASLCVAQDKVSLRTGMHSKYARLVFGWSSKADYKLEQTADGQINIRFNRSGALDQAMANFGEIPGISGIEETSQDPLSLRLQIPAGSSIRDFSIGKRVVLDVYLPGDMPEEPPKEALKESPKEQAKAKPPKEEPKPEALPEPAKEQIDMLEDKTPQIEQAEASPPAEVTRPEALPKTEEKKKETPEKRIRELAKEENALEYSQIIKDAINERQHVVSVRGTQGMSLAVFIEGNSLWIVVIGGSSFSLPSLMSPTPEIFTDIEAVQHDVFDVYRMGLPEDHEYYSIKVIGGALAWDIVIGEKVRRAQPIEPQRIVDSTNGIRGGKIIWPIDLIGEIVEIIEPNTGEKLIVVTVENATQLAGPARHFVDFDALSSPVGLTILPKVDDLRVQKTSEGIEITRPDNGLSISLPKDIEAIELYKTNKKNRMTTKQEQEFRDSLLFQFDKWQLGEIENVRRYEMVLLSAMNGQSEARLVQELLKLGKMFLAHGFASEALGYFQYASDLLPALGASAEFRALRGAAEALDWKSEDALTDFLYKDLQSYDEIKLWQSYVLAELGDWQQAYKVLPEDFDPIFTYPDIISQRLALTLAEVNLRAGKVVRAELLMHFVDNKREALREHQLAALRYLEGEASRQRGEKLETKRVWEELTQERDDLYRTKAGLALTMLLTQEGDLTNKQTIDQLERLRYAWRGDGLEAQVKYWLGDAYFKDKKYIKGLTIMRDAAVIATDTKVLADRIADDMARTFTDMFLTDELDSVSALDAVTVYDQFKELTPIDEKGDELVQRLAEHLVRSDLLGRAAGLLRYQVEHRLKGKEKLRIAIRLAAIELLDKNPQKAFDALKKAQDALKSISDTEQIRKRQREIDLLKIRAYAQNGEYNKALTLIDKVPMDKVVNRLRVDIAWKAGYWDIAAAGLKEVLLDEEITSDSKLTPVQVDLILNRAIALNLNDDRIGLANMREKYSRQLAEANKDKARQFELITRKQRAAVFEDNEALMSAVSEVDLFQGFLDSYRNSQGQE